MKVYTMDSQAHDFPGAWAWVVTSAGVLEVYGEAPSKPGRQVLAGFPVDVWAEEVDEEGVEL